MTYKETLFFVGKCLTISHENHNKKIVEDLLTQKTVDWENVVKVSTSHYVFPALYCNLKRVDFLHYLPEDLVEYMKHITDLNRERNEQIIEQAKEINDVLLKNNITPIFLKGTGNLLENLYEDIGERMVGDIDFLVKQDDFKNSISILKRNGYSEFDPTKPDDTIVNRHYPKMVKENRISSVEVHHSMVTDIRFSEFNFDFVKNDILSKNEIHFLSNEDKIIMTCINKQFNDNGYKLKNFSLRNSYDLFTLSRKHSPFNAITKLRNHLLLNPFLFSSYNILGEASTIDFKKNKSAKAFFAKQISNIDNRKKSETVKLLIKIKRRTNLFLKCFYSKKHRKYAFEKIKSLF